MKTSQAVIGRWGEVFESFGLPPITNNKHFKGKCPLCHKKGNFRIDDRNGTGSWICTCGNGNGFELIKELTGMTFEESCDVIDKIICNDSSKDNGFVDNGKSAVDRETDRFVKMLSIKYSFVEKYLNQRNIKILPEAAVKFSTSEFYEKDFSKMPAMHAHVTDYNDRLIYIHNTYLMNSQKAEVESPRKLFTIRSYEGSVSIKMFPRSKRLGIAEGIETALAAMQLTAINTWSVVNSAFMERFRVPEEVEILYIFADNDPNGTGLKAAFICGRSNIMRKNSLKAVHICWPVPHKSDFNDLLYINGNIPEIMKWVLTRD